jgi:hypothetical protein
MVGFYSDTFVSNNTPLEASGILEACSGNWRAREMFEVDGNSGTLRRNEIVESLFETNREGNVVVQGVAYRELSDVDRCRFTDRGSTTR